MYNHCKYTVLELERLDFFFFFCVERQTTYAYIKYQICNGEFLDYIWTQG